jgi:hypothetical protein
MRTDFYKTRVASKDYNPKNAVRPRGFVAAVNRSLIKPRRN